MKYPIVLLAGSLLINGGMVTALVFRPSLAPPDFQSYFETTAARERRVAAERGRRERADEQRARLEAARAAKLWTTLDATDLRTLVARLRAAGFPPHLVRAIVGGEINERYSSRMKALLAELDQAPYWKPQRLVLMNSKFMEERNQLARDRVKEMRALLGDDYFANSHADPTAAQRARFGNLSPQKIELVSRIVDDYAEMASDVRAAANGIMLPEDREKLAFLDREKRADLAAVLTPQELEDYDMRTSQITMRLRPALTLMDATEDEFRTIYRIEQQYDSQLNPLAGGGGILAWEMSQQRQEAEAQVDQRIRQALGEARAAEFLRDSSSEFQRLSRLAGAQNLPADAAIHAYDLRTAAAEESMRIANDAAQSAEQKIAALKVLADQTRNDLMTTLGPAAGQTYVNTSNWLKAMQRGQAFSFRGNMTMFRGVGSAPPPHP